MFTRRKIVQVLALCLGIIALLDLIVSILVVEAFHAAGW